MKECIFCDIVRTKDNSSKKEKKSFYMKMT